MASHSTCYFLTVLWDLNTSAMNTFASDVSVFGRSLDRRFCAQDSHKVSSVRNVKDGPRAGLVVVVLKAEYGFWGSDWTEMFVTWGYWQN